MPRVMTIGRIGTLGACSCQQQQSAPVRASFSGLFGHKKRKSAVKRAGKHCVVSKKGKTFNCYKSMATARRVAKKLGKGFKVKH